MKMFISCLQVILAAATFAPGVQGTRSFAAETLHAPGDFSTIQKAIDAAAPGDVVLVKAGTCQERIRLRERITLRSDGDGSRGKLGLQRAENTIIDGGRGGNGAGVEFHQSALVVKNPPRPSTLMNNVAVSKDPQAKAAQIEGSEILSRGNVLKQDDGEVSKTNN